MTDNIFAAHLNEVEELGWEEVAARMDRWAEGGYQGDWQDSTFDPPKDWSWPDFMTWLS